MEQRLARRHLDALAVKIAGDRAPPQKDDADEVVPVHADGFRQADASLRAGLRHPEVDLRQPAKLDAAVDRVRQDFDEDGKGIDMDEHPLPVGLGIVGGVENRPRHASLVQTAPQSALTDPRTVGAPEQARRSSSTMQLIRARETAPPMNNS